MRRYEAPLVGAAQDEPDCLAKGVEGLEAAEVPLATAAWSSRRPCADRDSASSRARLAEQRVSWAEALMLGPDVHIGELHVPAHHR